MNCEVGMMEDLEIRKRKKKAYDIEVGDRVRRTRETAGQTQQVFSEVLNLSPQYVSKIETGKMGLSTMLAVDISDIYGVSCDYLLKGVEQYNDISEILEKAKFLGPGQLKLAEKNLLNQFECIALAERRRHSELAENE